MFTLLFGPGSWSDFGDPLDRAVTESGQGAGEILAYRDLQSAHPAAAAGKPASLPIPSPRQVEPNILRIQSIS
jgi:hypothetical protein